jgi:hypothetical protein
LVHVHPQTARALNERVKRAVPSLKSWATYLSGEIAKQSPPPDERTSVSKYSQESWPETITLTLRRNDLEKMIDELRTHARELGNFTA